MIDEEVTGPGQIRWSADREVTTVAVRAARRAAGSRRTDMSRLSDAISIVAGRSIPPRLRRPALSARWLRDAVVANRVAFEYEMRRERRRLLDSRFETFWKEMSARQA